MPCARVYSSMGVILGSHPQLPRFKGVTFKIKCGVGNSTWSAPNRKECRRLKGATLPDRADLEKALIQRSREVT